MHWTKHFAFHVDWGDLECGKACGNKIYKHVCISCMYKYSDWFDGGASCVALL